MMRYGCPEQVWQGPVKKILVLAPILCMLMCRDIIKEWPLLTWAGGIQPEELELTLTLKQQHRAHLAYAMTIGS